MYNVCIEMLELIPGYKPTEFRQSFFSFVLNGGIACLLFYILRAACSLYKLM